MEELDLSNYVESFRDIYSYKVEIEKKLINKAEKVQEDLFDPDISIDDINESLKEINDLLDKIAKERINVQECKKKAFARVAQDNEITGYTDRIEAITKFDEIEKSFDFGDYHNFRDILFRLERSLKYIEYIPARSSDSSSFDKDLYGKVIKGLELLDSDYYVRMGLRNHDSLVSFSQYHDYEQIYNEDNIEFLSKPLGMPITGEDRTDSDDDTLTDDYSDLMPIGMEPVEDKDLMQHFLTFLSTWKDKNESEYNELETLINDYNDEEAKKNEIIEKISKLLFKAAIIKLRGEDDKKDLFGTLTDDKILEEIDIIPFNCTSDDIDTYVNNVFNNNVYMEVYRRIKVFDMIKRYASMLEGLGFDVSVYQNYISGTYSLKEGYKIYPIIEKILRDQLPSRLNYSDDLSDENKNKINQAIDGYVSGIIGYLGAVVDDKTPSQLETELNDFINSNKIQKLDDKSSSKMDVIYKYKELFKNYIPSEKIDDYLDFIDSILDPDNIDEALVVDKIKNLLKIVIISKAKYGISLTVSNITFDETSPFNFDEAFVPLDGNPDDVSVAFDNVLEKYKKQQLLPVIKKLKAFAKASGLLKDDDLGEFKEEYESDVYLKYISDGLNVLENRMYDALKAVISDRKKVLELVTVFVDDIKNANEEPFNADMIKNWNNLLKGKEMETEPVTSRDNPDDEYTGFKSSDSFLGAVKYYVGIFKSKDIPELYDDIDTINVLLDVYDSNVNLLSDIEFNLGVLFKKYIKIEATRKYNIPNKLRDTEFEVYSPIYLNPSLFDSNGNMIGNFVYDVENPLLHSYINDAVHYMFSTMLKSVNKLKDDKLINKLKSSLGDIENSFIAKVNEGQDGDLNRIVEDCVDCVTKELIDVVKNKLGSDLSYIDSYELQLRLFNQVSKYLIDGDDLQDCVDDFVVVIKEQIDKKKEKEAEEDKKHEKSTEPSSEHDKGAVPSTEPQQDDKKEGSTEPKKSEEAETEAPKKSDDTDKNIYQKEAQVYVELFRYLEGHTSEFETVQITEDLFYQILDKLMIVDKSIEKDEDGKYYVKRGKGTRQELTFARLNKLLSSKKRKASIEIGEIRNRLNTKTVSKVDTRKSTLFSGKQVVDGKMVDLVSGMKTISVSIVEALVAGNIDLVIDYDTPGKIRISFEKKQETSSEKKI